jgi:hypothetical protein
VRPSVSKYATPEVAVASGAGQEKNSGVFRSWGETMLGTLVLPAATFAPRTLEKAPLRSADDLRRAVLNLRGPFPRVDVTGLDRVLRVDPAGDRIEVQCATTWRTLAEHAAHAAPGLVHFARDSWLHPTIGQSVAENSPGPDGRPLVAHIEAVALVTPDGQLRRASRLSDPEMFALVIGGHGAFGAPYSVTLRLSSLARSAACGRRPEILDLNREGDKPTGRLGLFLPPECLEDFLGEARTHSLAWRVPIARVEVRATQAESETRLRWAQREYAAVALHLPRPSRLGENVRYVQTHRALIAAAIARGGSFELSASAPVAPEHIDRCYPMMAAFFADKQRYDPAGRFENAWTGHYRALLRRAACKESRWAGRATAATAGRAA